MNEKAQGHMFWVIITAVIALVVLVVVLVIFTKGISGPAEGLMSCEGKGGECVLVSDVRDCKGECEAKGKSYSSVFTCPERVYGETYCCCFGITKPENK
jgi:hypothetical protein